MTYVPVLGAEPFQVAGYFLAICAQTGFNWFLLILQAAKLSTKKRVVATVFKIFGMKISLALDLIMAVLPPRINFGISLKDLKLPIWGIFFLPLTHRVKIIEKFKSGTLHISHHASHIAY